MLLDHPSVKDYGAIGDGAADDSKAFRDTIDAVAPGMTIYVPSGVYALRTPITAVNANNKGVYVDFLKPNLTLEMHPEARVVFHPEPTIRKGRTYYGIRVMTDHITLRGGTLEAIGSVGPVICDPKTAPPDGFFNLGICVAGSPVGTLVTDVSVLGFTWGMVLGGGNSETIVERCRTTGGMWGIAIVSGNGMTVRDCLVQDANLCGFSAGIRIEPSSFLATNMYIGHNRVVGCPSGISANKPLTAEGKYLISNLTVDRNTVIGDGTRHQGIFIGHAVDNVLIVNNRCEGFSAQHDSCGIHANGNAHRDVIISHNSCRDNTHGIRWHRWADDAAQQGAIIESNICRDNKVGISVVRPRSVDYWRNLCVDNQTDLLVTP